MVQIARLSDRFIPVVRASCKRLMLCAPEELDINDINDIKDDITEISGVVSCHHVFIWELDDQSLFASLYVGMAGSCDSSDVMRMIRWYLHDYGIHSSIIRPDLAKIRDFYEQFEVSYEEEI